MSFWRAIAFIPPQWVYDQGGHGSGKTGNLGDGGDGDGGH